ncbi:OsmC family protein [Alicyclobacillus tolerans]|uniref:OsmC family protein n=1 Tax=Alicyclobacillus tolerans TaxID=90970 RepID=UPI001F20307C|nr:OsmC family protein [Alicyclobacillus tolerans]MCF8563243.1 OsmC family protein [Alicyclobacillus tolerans]
MADLQFSIRSEWTGTGREGHGAIHTGEQTVEYSAPYEMGGKGQGSSPEELLLSAVTSCYSATLYGVLKRDGLQVSKVEVQTQGVVTDYPLKAKFSRLIVSPTIFGGVVANQAEYVKAANTARERCFIGKTILGNVEYEVGDVTVTA